MKSEQKTVFYVQWIWNGEVPMKVKNTTILHIINNTFPYGWYASC